MRGSLSKFEYIINFTSAANGEANSDSLPQAPSVRRPLNSAELIQIRPSESGSSFIPQCSFSKQGFFQLFGQVGGNEIVWIIGGQVCIRVQAYGKLGGSGGMLPQEILILDLLLDTIQ